MVQAPTLTSVTVVPDIGQEQSPIRADMWP
jgi:hypothetical protein